MKTKTLFFSSLIAAAAMSSVPAFADAETIKISYGSNNNEAKAGGGTITFDSDTGWNKATNNSNSDSAALIKLCDSTGTETTATTTWTSKNTWYLPAGTATSADEVLKGYLDDGTGVTISVSNISYLVYDVTVIASTDTANKQYTAKTINGQTYTSNGSGNGILGNTTWGTTNTTTVVAGENSFTVSGLYGDLSLSSTGSNDSARGCVAGLIITNATGADAIAATLDGTASTWTTESLAGTKWTNSTDTTPTYANLTMSEATTLTLDSGVITDAVWAHGSGALTLAGEDLTFRGLGILRADTGTSIAVNNTLNFTNGGTLSGTITTGDNGSIVVKSGTMNATALTGSGLNFSVESGATVNFGSVAGISQNLTGSGTVSLNSTSHGATIDLGTAFAGTVNISGNVGLANHKFGSKDATVSVTGTTHFWSPNTGDQEIKQALNFKNGSTTKVGGWGSKTGTLTLSGDLAFEDGASFVIADSSAGGGTAITVNIAGAVTNGNFTLNSGNAAGTLKFSGSGTNTISTLTQSGGTLNITAGTTEIATLTQTAGTLTVSSAGALDLSDATVALSSAISNSGTVKVNSGTTFALSGLTGTTSGNTTTYSLVDGGSLSGWDTLTLSNVDISGTSLAARDVTATFSNGSVSITGTAGDLVWSGGESVNWNYSTDNKPWTITSGGITTATSFMYGDNVTFNTDDTVTVTVDSSGVTARTMTVSAGTVTLSDGKVTTTDGITVNGTGTLKISSNSNIGGNVTVGTGGTFDLNGKSGDVMWNTGFSTLTLAGGKVVNNGSSVGTLSRQLYTLAVTADSEIGGTGNFGLIGNGYGATTLNLGANTLTKTGDNTLWLINTTVNGTGTIKVSGGSIADNKSDSSLTLGNASIVLDGGSANFSGTVIAGASTLNGGSVDEKQMSIGTLKFGYGSGAQTLNISGKVSVTGNFQEASSGVSNDEKITLSDGANFSVGGTFGTTNDNASDTGQHTYILNVGSGASFSAGTIAHGDGLTVNIGNGNASVSATTLVLNSVWGKKTHYFTGQGADVSTLSVGAVSLNNTGSYTTTFSVSNARFEVGTGGITGSSSTPVSLNGVTLGVRDGADSWSSSLAMTLAGAMGADVASDKSITLDGVLSGTTTGFTKTGDGTLTLGGANTFSGGVTISAGKLVANSNSALGAAAGSVRIAGGQLEVSSGITLAQTNIEIALSDAYSTEAAIAAILGEGALASGTTITLTAADKAMVALLTEKTKEYQIFASGTSLASDFSVDSFTLDKEAWADWKISGYDATTGKVTLEMIPEPSAFGLLAGVGALVFVAARRRRRAK